MEGGWKFAECCISYSTNTLKFNTEVVYIMIRDTGKTIILWEGELITLIW